MDDQGFWAADGCSFAGGNNNANGFNAANVLQYYTDSNLGAARPCAALALKGRAIKMAWTIDESNGFGKDDQGHSTGPGGVAELQANGWMNVDALMSETYINSDESFLALNNGAVITYEKTTNTTSTGQAGQFLVKVWEMYEAAQKATTSAPAPTPVASLTPGQQLDLDAMAAIKAALAA